MNLNHFDFPEIDLSNPLFEKAINKAFRKGMLHGVLLTSLFWVFILTYLAL